MADDKALYSEASNYYTEVKVPESEIDRERYKRSKLREAKYNENGVKKAVNINRIIDYFCPDFEAVEKGVKFIFKGSDYEVVCDMAAGYLRIRDRKLKCWVTLDGKPIKNIGDGHYKIKKREEM